MQEVLILKLHQYIRDNHPDLLLSLQKGSSVITYLRHKIEAIDYILEQLLATNTPAYIIEEYCMDELTKDLRPSKFNYLLSILEGEFEANYYPLKENGLLTYEVINLLQSCTPVFETFGFSEQNEADRHLRYTIIGIVKEHFENKQ